MDLPTFAVHLEHTGLMSTQATPAQPEKEDKTYKTDGVVRFYL